MGGANRGIIEQYAAGAILDRGAKRHHLAGDVRQPHQDASQIADRGRVHHRHRSGQYGTDRQDHLRLLHDDRQEWQAAMKDEGAISADQRNAMKTRHSLISVEQAARRRT